MNTNGQNVRNIANNTNLVVSNNNCQQNVNYHYQQQQQQQQFNQQEEQAIILFYIYEDFQNFLNLLYSFQTVQEYFQHDPQNILISICQNKLITQMNLSNSIHYDLSKNQKNPDLKSFLQKNKNDLKKHIRSVCPPNSNWYIEYYEKYCLNEDVQIKNIELKPTKLKVNFNEEVLQQILPQIQAIDNRISQIRQTQNYKQPSIETMKSKAWQYQQDTLQKLKTQSCNKLKR